MKTVQTPTHVYSEQIALPDGSKIELRGESYARPIHTIGEAFRSQLLTINARSKGTLVVNYATNEMTDKELMDEIKVYANRARKCKSLPELLKIARNEK
jgi:hypothetical protein